MDVWANGVYNEACALGLARPIQVRGLQVLEFFQSAPHALGVATSQRFVDDEFDPTAQRGVADSGAIAGGEGKQDRLQRLNDIRHLGTPEFFPLAQPEGGQKLQLCISRQSVSFKPEFGKSAVAL